MAKPIIKINGLPMSDKLALVDEALRPFDVFQRAGKIVRVASVILKDRNAAPLPAQAVRDMNMTYLGSVMREAANWVSSGPDGTKNVDTIKLANEMLSRGGHDYPFRYLAGIVNAPTMRADGTILNKPGYDEQSGLLFDPRGATFPTIPDVPSGREVAEATALIDDMLSEFPFKDESGGAVSKGVAISAFLSMFVRPLLPACPGFAFTAPRPGTGKSYMVDLIATAATGYPAHPIPVGHTSEEFEKRLTAELLAGRPIISIDNVQSLINDPLLCQCLTAPKVTPRILGKSQNAEIDMVAAVFINGNNLSVSQDLVRRVLVCRLDADVERPEQREFQRNPLAHVAANRPKYVAAALILLRHHQNMLAMDAAPTLSPYVGYDDWSRMVRGCIVGLGYADPVQSIESSYQDDPAREALASLLSVWGAEFGGRKITVNEIVQLAKYNTALRDTLIGCQVKHSQNDIDPLSLTWYLRRNLDVRIGALKLVSPGVGRVRTYALHGVSSQDQAVVVPLRTRRQQAQEEFAADEYEREAADLLA